MENNIWLYLQLFADGGDGGGDGGASAAASGESAVVAVQPVKSLEELGVPRDRIERLKNRANRKSVQAGNAITIVDNPATQANEQDRAAAEENAQPQKEDAKKPTWDELMKDPDYNRQMQQVVQARLKDDKGAKETLQKLAPILESLGAKYSLDTSDVNNLDIDALTKAVAGDDSYYEQRADELGVSPETARQLDQLEKFKARQEEQQRQTIEQQTRQQHYMKLVQQADALKAVFPNFDLQTELQNPTFLRMTSPQIGLSVEDAYYAVHRKEIQTASMQATARNVEQKLAASIAANKTRPSENGIGTQASTLGAVDFKHLSKEQREGIKQQVRAAKASGRTLYPGQIFSGR